ncbi:MAG: hypothetical protein AVDCRST_MAG56-6713 [uncultured Cytophagales bacterium]|uniref:Uncharacterized protein n=1 Tax=uncultured Cytophagales bacterium TaxID=158755 RepID=A0A6J4KY31_9SPHI|nr:MAG: hypothetical protein AVDCRST_MAG56-6713 [uncultured Cytophagales bacterium]
MCATDNVTAAAAIRRPARPPLHHPLPTTAGIQPVPAHRIFYYCPYLT